MQKLILSIALLAMYSISAQSPQEGIEACPYLSAVESAKAQSSEKKMGKKEFFPNRLNLDILRQNSGKTSPMSADFDYIEAFRSLDYYALKEDIRDVLTDSKDWWPADWGHYGGLFIRMAWHSAGTYRTGDGRGGSRAGQQRFAPLNSWPDNANLDKARRLLWPVKQKYGKKISWADLMILAGNVALEDMGLETAGFAGGRKDVFEPKDDIYWGPESELLESKRFDEDGDLEDPLAASQMGLIYVNPEGPGGEPDPMAAAEKTRITFKRMGMNDEQTVALIAGGHTLGKTHAAASGSHKGPAPEKAPIEEQGLGWKSDYKSGKGEDVITSSVDVTWTSTPTEWSHDYLTFLFKYDWELMKSPAGGDQWVAKDADKIIPHPFEGENRKPYMLTTDIALIKDPKYRKISKRFLEDEEAFQKAFAEAWFKLTHRDMGPKSSYVGPEVPEKDYIWQDPIPEVDHTLVNNKDVEQLKNQILKTDLSHSELVKAAWASASTYRQSDRRGGANGAHILLDPMRDWEANDPKELDKVITALEKVQNNFNRKAEGDKEISMADLIVLAGNAAIEDAAAKAGVDAKVPFEPGRMDALQDQTDVESMQYLEPEADGFRNYMKDDYTYSAEEMLIDKAQLLDLTPPEMTVLVGGMRVLGANTNNVDHGVFTDEVGTLSNDFFVNLLSMDYKWNSISEEDKVFEVVDRKTGERKWTATRVDLIFGSNSELRALCEVYAAQDAQKKFVLDFIDAWSKVMQADRFDLRM
jgi:catalase-peroxidase